MYREITYTERITRSMTRLLNNYLIESNNFIILESYRCMPLLGNEIEHVPDWDIHIVHYTIIFINK